MRLARSMPQAVKDVAAELQARAEARAAVEERAQAASEAEEIARAKKLLEENTVAATQQQRRRETREERLERLRLERELREREQQQKRRQRQLETAAARLHISVEDLEADEKLLRSIEENASHLAAAPVPAPSLEGYPNKDDHEERPIDEEDGLARKKPVVMFSRPVISNEGIAREMKELEKLQHDHQEQPMLSHANDGIRLPEEKEEDDDDAKPHTGKQASHSKGARGPRHDDLEDEDASFGINGLMRRRQRRL
ncbi:unnamed protein product [Phytomonas sp. EM1]|nr:unnamed protein product [Phytomonas sp. EM1]|eukprot:CCW65297.1 unnamed protein product [Phytomonas sp. isolate EM1]